MYLNEVVDLEIGVLQKKKVRIILKFKMAVATFM